jgi:hypothetical protein
MFNQISSQQHLTGQPASPFWAGPRYARPLLAALAFTSEKGVFVRNLVILSIVLLAGCKSTDYTKELAQVTNCPSQLTSNSENKISFDKKVTLEIGGENKKCFVNSKNQKHFYNQISVPHNANFLVVNAHQNVGMDNSSFFKPQLLIKSENGELIELAPFRELKSSTFIAVRYYTYYYDLRSIKSRDIIITADPNSIGNNIPFEYLNSHDYVTVHTANMPLSAGGMVEVQAALELENSKS